jgi:hypothetical protein
MPPEHPDFSNVNLAYEKVLDVADYLDEERGKAEATNKVNPSPENIEYFK